MAATTKFNFGKGCDADGTSRTVDDFNAGDAGDGEASRELAGEGLGGDGDDLRMPALALLEEGVEVRASSERNGMKAVGVGLTDA